MDLQGKIVQLLPEQRGQGKKGEWVNHSFVIEFSDNGYMQKLCLEVYGAEKWEKMQQSVVVGNDVSVKFSVSSRSWNNRWFTSANCYYCAAVGGSVVQSAVENAEVVRSDEPERAPVSDLPF